MNDLQYKSVPFVEVKAEGDGSEFEGWAAAFHNIDAYGDIIAPGAFAESIPFLLASGLVLFNHCEPIGKPLSAREDAKGLFVRGKVSDTATGRDVKTLLKDDVIRKMSIGYRTVQSKGLTADEVKAYWAAQGYTPTADDLATVEDLGGYGARLLTKVKVYEFSPVGFPANGAADITGVKGAPRLSQIRQFARRALKEVKAGKVLSGSNRKRIAGVRDGLKAAHDDLHALLEETEPKSPDGQGDPDNDAAKALARRVETARAMLSLHKSAI